jgi:cell division protein FtsQ
VWAALKSPWATVQRIEVTGTDRVSPATIRGEALPEVGHPMLLARTSDIAARVKAQRLIRSVTVERHWPGTLRVRVVEREPVAVLPVGSQLALVDDDGVVIQRVLASHAPAGLPRVEVSLAVAGNGVLRGCLDVLHGLPANLAGQVSSIGADSSDGIWLKLKDGARVEWGDSADTPHKAQVLTALLPQHGVNYDVRSPDTPAVRGK